MGKSYRPGRLGEEIRRILSSMLLKDLKDPRLAKAMISITSVEVTSDGSYATIYLSVLPTDGGEQKETEKEAIEGLEHCKGAIKRRIGKDVKFRHIPELLFKIDNSLEYGRRMDALIAEVVKKDEEHEG